MIERLTNAQKSRVRKAYREAYAEVHHVRAINDLYTKFIDLYGVSIQTLQQICTEDRARHRVEYRALQAIRDGLQQANTPKTSRDHKTFCPVCTTDVKVSTGPLPVHKSPTGRACDGKGMWGVSKEAALIRSKRGGRKKKAKTGKNVDSDRHLYYGTSVRTVGGGLPGLGRRR